ncbi:MAG: DUF2357 domain-containing protein [Abitibacteriaceae bacterium]|nr:DUF2357 domain-containing protein [Abditibacteriaceae bacterium]MBV9866916.1 DUF2357 domain-containing protein [Abditibacteriaceae bacterium]
MLSPTFTPNFGAGQLWSKDDNGISSIPADLQEPLAPATHYLYEWVDYWLQYPDADRLRINETWIKPVYDSLFSLRFENRLGLASLQPFAGSRPLCPPLQVEIISPKLPTPATHLTFLQALLDDLYRRAARLPFTFQTSTSRGVTHSLAPATPLFILHFLLAYAPSLQAALTIIQAAPHRELYDEPILARLAEATQADADTLMSILHAPEDWVPAPSFPLAKRLGGHAPAHVGQRAVTETYDTPENRFVLAFTHELLLTITQLTRQSWWHQVSPERQQQIDGVRQFLQQTIAHPIFAEVGPLQRLPTTSQVLLRRDGYRDLLNLWQMFQQARRPLFATLQQAIDVRDIALLYEIWTFFALVEAIAEMLQETPVIDLRTSDARGLERQTAARFGTGAQLIYNQSSRAYSTTFRPDFTWIINGRAEVVLDAKFRLNRQSLEAARFDDREDEDSPQAAANRADLYKMHTYRDALGVRAAVSLYPGQVSIFYDTQNGRLVSYTLRDLLLSHLSGIGALAMTPAER